MKNQGSVSPSKSHHSSTKSKDNELADMSDGEIKSLLLKMINDLKENSNK
jgi:hypothetical protein